MKKFRDIMLISDGDGTLLNQSNQIPQKNIEALRYFMKQGGSFVLATGRPKNGARHIWEILPDHSMPTIYFNGALIYDPTQQAALHADVLPAGMHRVLQFLLDDFSEIGIECYTIDQAFVLQDSEITQMHIKMLHETPQYVSVKDIPETGILKMFVTGSHQETRAVQHSLLETFPNMFQAVPSGDVFLEIFSLQSDKGAAVRFLKQYYPQKKRFYAVGDNYNDFSMFREVEQAFVPENGVPKAKEIGRVVSSCDTGALFDVIQYLDALY